MTKNITLTISKHEYEQRPTAVALGYAYNVSYQMEGVDQVDKVNRARMVQYDAIDSALLETLTRASRGYYEVDVIIEGATLPESLQSHLTDKFEVESQINSVVFV